MVFVQHISANHTIIVHILRKCSCWSVNQAHWL